MRKETKEDDESNHKAIPELSRRVRLTREAEGETGEEEMEDTL